MFFFPTRLLLDFRHDFLIYWLQNLFTVYRGIKPNNEIMCSVKWRLSRRHFWVVFWCSWERALGLNPHPDFRKAVLWLCLLLKLIK